MIKKLLILTVAFSLLNFSGLAEAVDNPAMVREAKILAAQVTATRNYLEKLKLDLAEAKRAGDKAKEKTITGLIATNQQRLNEITAKLAPLYDYYYKSGYEITGQNTKADLPEEAPRPSSLALETGLKGGAGVIEIVYSPPFMRTAKTEIRIGGGSGVGTNYSLLLLQGEWVFKPNPGLFLGLSFDHAIYSEAAADIIGLPPEIEKGSRIGMGVFVGKNIGNGYALVGLSSAIGVTVAAGWEI